MKESLEQSSGDYTVCAKSGYLCTFVNKILWEQSHGHLFTHYLQLLSHYDGRVEKS